MLFLFKIFIFIFFFIISNFAMHENQIRLSESQLSIISSVQAKTYIFHKSLIPNPINIQKKDIDFLMENEEKIIALNRVKNDACMNKLMIRFFNYQYILFMKNNK